MDGKKIAIWVVVAAAIVTVGFLVLRPATSGAGVTNVDAQEMQQLVDDGVRVIDVRTEGEFTAGHIPGAEIVPVAQIEAAAAGWDREEPIAIYCATGSRSTPVVEFLADQGFETVYHYDAGIVTWEGEIEGGAAATAPTSGSAEFASETSEGSGIPVMYEFYTDT